MSAGDDDLVPEEDRSTVAAVFWALLFAIGLGMFLFDFGNVVLETSSGLFPAVIIQNLQRTLFFLAILGGGGVVAIVTYIVLRHSAPVRDAPSILRPGQGRYTLTVYTVGVVFLMLTTIFLGSSTLAMTDEANTPVEAAEVTDTNRLIQMQVTGGQWFWRHDVEGVPFTQAERVVVPSNTIIWFEITSADVIHSWAIQELSVKKDAVPGQTNDAWFLVKQSAAERKIEEGYVGGEKSELTFTTADGETKTVPAAKYVINCAELCGKGHSKMVGTLVVVSPEDYEEWVEAKGGSVPESFRTNTSVALGEFEEG